MGDFADDACNRELDEWLYDMEAAMEESNTDREFTDSFPYGRKPHGPGSCPECGGETIIAEGRFGEFYGCKKFPLCKGSRSL